VVLGKIKTFEEKLEVAKYYMSSHDSPETNEKKTTISRCLGNIQLYCTPITDRRIGTKQRYISRIKCVDHSCARDEDHLESWAEHRQFRLRVTVGPLSNS